jgi:hypothetical protein
MNNVDYNAVDAAKAIARAHGVPTWVVEQPIECCDECTDNDRREAEEIAKRNRQ